MSKESNGATAEQKRVRECISNYVKTLGFPSQWSQHQIGLARAVTHGFIMLDPMHPELDVEVMTLTNHKFTLTFSGFQSEVGLEKTYDGFLNRGTRAAGYACVEAVSWNPGVSTITATINGMVAAPTENMPLSQPRKSRRGGAGSGMHGGGGRRQRRSSGGDGGGQSIQVDASKLVDLTNVDPAHHALVGGIGAGIVHFESVMPKLTQRAVVNPAQDKYKMLVFGMNKEFDISRMYRRLLGPTGHRDDWASMVSGVGLEPRNNTLVIRIERRHRVKVGK